ncbi:glycoside hydrolase family 88 protein [Sediminibacterium ginsengisoli]|uniref:Glycosyl Hydrolase Family 88 n=1 Tax=Sediminibacterium ginsengisoli TaxID=413434 RepID=A0A1T4QK61_9BACT|nr:glycoside hydrolase family 88 protein [Sediminibacterium ginsengisoli]SKA03871.1 Glycosyl Hydrolase Family 88 [Sediminibacterium ginsengisoli]
MKRLLIAFIGTVALVYNTAAQTSFVKENFTFAGNQLKAMLKEADKNDTLFPRTITAEGNMKGTNKYDWTSGFFPGSLWYTYEYTKDESLKQAAVRWTETLEPVKNFSGHHDLGFMMYCSYGNAYRLTKDERYKDILVQTARSLCTRFDEKVGSIKSWNSFRSFHTADTRRYEFPVIIDNMMNLELLFFASKVTGDPYFRKVALRHAETTMKHHLRNDYSSYHVVCYDSTGKPLIKETAQGYADNSTWARGQSWGIYGFTVMYRETKDKRYLETARKMADHFLNNPSLPADKVPLWDFNVGQEGYVPAENSKARPNSPKFRDASAAAITSSALFELSGYLGTEGKKYRDAAEQMLKSLAGKSYRAEANSNGNFIITHCVGSLPHGFELDVPIVYADYYFLEALKRYNDLIKK